MAVHGNREAHEILLIEEADAWFEYLEAIRGQTAVRYAEIEPWAWVRLTPAAAHDPRAAGEAAARPPRPPEARDRPSAGKPLLRSLEAMPRLSAPSL